MCLRKPLLQINASLRTREQQMFTLHFQGEACVAADIGMGCLSWNCAQPGDNNKQNMRRIFIEQLFRSPMHSPNLFIISNKIRFLPSFHSNPSAFIFESIFNLRQYDTIDNPRLLIRSIEQVVPRLKHAKLPSGPDGALKAALGSLFESLSKSPTALAGPWVAEFFCVLVVGQTRKRQESTTYSDHLFG